MESVLLTSHHFPPLTQEFAEFHSMPIKRTVHGQAERHWLSQRSFFAIPVSGLGGSWVGTTTSSMLKATGGSISIYTRTIAASFRFGDKPCDTEKVLQCLAQALTDILLIIFHPRWSWPDKVAKRCLRCSEIHPVGKVSRQCNLKCSVDLTIVLYQFSNIRIAFGGLISMSAKSRMLGSPISPPPSQWISSNLSSSFNVLPPTAGHPSSRDELWEVRGMFVIHSEPLWSAFFYLHGALLIQSWLCKKAQYPTIAL